MKAIGILALLFIATAAFASQPQKQSTARDFALDFATPAGTQVNGAYVQPNLLTSSPKTIDGTESQAKVLGPFADPGNTCYFIRSYIMKREGEAGATHLDHVTTCTPQSRIKMKTKVKFTPAVVK